MAFVCVDKDGQEVIFSKRPIRFRSVWTTEIGGALDYVELPLGSIAKLIGRGLTWEDEPVELK